MSEAAWTKTGPNRGDEWQRIDGVRVVAHGNGGTRCWNALKGPNEYLRGKLFAGSSTLNGPVRSFATAEAAMRAADAAFPLATAAKP